MKNLKKSEYLQIRVSKQEKELIKSSAQSAGVDMSAWILQRVLNNKAEEFSAILKKINADNQSYVLAELNDFLSNLNTNNFELALNSKSIDNLNDFQINYIIAMIVHRANQLSATPPDWIKLYERLDKPYFGTNLKSLRLHLLINSPIAFKQRNIFIDSSIGDRV